MSARESVIIFAVGSGDSCELTPHRSLPSERTEKPLQSKNSKLKDAPAEAVKVSVKKSQSFVPFSQAISHSWEGLSLKKQKKMSPILFATLGGYQKGFSPETPQLYSLAVIDCFIPFPHDARLIVLWEYQSRHHGASPESPEARGELESIAAEVLPKHSIDPSLLPGDVLEYVTTPCLRLMLSWFDLCSSDAFTCEPASCRPQLIGGDGFDRVHASLRNHRGSPGSGCSQRFGWKRATRHQPVHVRWHERFGRLLPARTEGSSVA